jgi:hypothetical protein
MARHKKGSKDRLLMMLACGATADAAARNLGISERTVSRRLADPAFCQRLQQLRGDMVQPTAAMLTAAAGEADKTLLALLKESQPGAVRLGAARAVVELSLKVREAAEFEQRLAAVEVAQQAHYRPGANGRAW